MAKKDRSELLQGVGFAWDGRLFFAESTALPLVDFLKASLKSAGLASVIDHPRLPPGASGIRSQWRMDVGVTTAILVITAFIGSSIGSWAVGTLCDRFWDGHVAPALQKLRNRKGDGEDDYYPYWFEFRVYYATDEFFVVVRALVASPEDLDCAATLVPEAERKALAWVRDRGIDSAGLLYSIRHGELSEIPRKISEQPNSTLEPAPHAKRTRRRSPRRR